MKKERLEKKKERLRFGSGMGGIQEEEKEELLRREKAEKGRNGELWVPTPGTGQSEQGTGHIQEQRSESRDGGRLTPTTTPTH